MRSRWTTIIMVLLLGGCTPFRCEHAGPMDFSAAPPPPLDLSVLELGRPPGNACATLDNCNRFAADTCDTTCKCGSDNPCDEGRQCCGGRCVDPLSDTGNCGGCGIACGSGQCVHPDGGSPHCTCESDDGGSGDSCALALEPTCNGEGLCTCGPSSVGVCNSLDADACANGACTCGGGAACSGPYVDHCDPGRGCQCGSQPACDPKLATSCDPTAADSPCRCANGPGCQAGTFCCTQNSTCCSPSQYCCLDGCCDQPCLVFGFCH